jgi:lysophospholipase L1-like esterase
MPRFRSLIVAVVLSAGLAAADEFRPVRLACVGDSITAGYLLLDADHQAYPAQLGRLLGAGWEVQNFGVSGACLMDEGGYPYARRERCAEALAWKPDLVVLALGTNDTKAENIRSHPGAFLTSYHAMLDRFRKANPQVRFFLCLPPPVFAPAMGLDGDILMREILPQIRQIAAEEHLPLIDLHEPLAGTAAHFPDQVHPDVGGAGLIARIVYGELMAATQPRAKALDPSVNTAVIPVPALEQDCYNWWARHADQLALHETARPAVVLIGDSITHFWAGEPAGNRVNGPRAWSDAFGTIPVVNLGFGWDRTQNVLWRLDHGEFDGYQPRLVVLNIGTNNLTRTENARINTPNEIAAAIAAICDRLHTKAPAAHLLVMGIFPRGHHANDWIRSPISAANAKLAQVLAGRPGVTFIDIGPRYLDVRGEMDPTLMPDGTHPSETGYAIWSRALVETGLLPKP